MFQVATIRFDAGALLLPASDPYDREVVFEQAEFYARRHGSVDVQIGRSAIRAACGGDRPGAVCTRCRELLRAVSFHIGDQRYCTQCMKRGARHVEDFFRRPH